MSLVKVCLGVFVIVSMGNILTAACSKNFGGHDALQFRVEGHHFRGLFCLNHSLTQGQSRSLKSWTLIPNS